MAGAAVRRFFPPFPNTNNLSSLSSASRLHFHFFPLTTTAAAAAAATKHRILTRSLSTSRPRTRTRLTTPKTFAFSDSDEETVTATTTTNATATERKLPPPYDPFNKKPAIEEPEDPKDLQQIFHTMKTEGLTNHAVKMFDALSRDGLTHEALQLFSQIKDKGHMPDVVAHTAVIEAYANASKPKEALKVYIRMLASGVNPNAYTYSVLIRGLASHRSFIDEAKKLVLDMIGKGMRPNAATYISLFEGFARENMVEEGTQFLEQMKARGFEPDEKAVKESLGNKRGQVYRTLMHILFSK